MEQMKSLEGLTHGYERASPISVEENSAAIDSRIDQPSLSALEDLETSGNNGQTGAAKAKPLLTSCGENYSLCKQMITNAEILVFLVQLVGLP
ncbi:TPA: hypothetical protein BOS_4291 [Bos taurus]|nr:TPA: hypothetical protein BOS_4291 [Bos taurus]